jgi:hypothetical protein
MAETDLSNRPQGDGHHSEHERLLGRQLDLRVHQTDRVSRMSVQQDLRLILSKNTQKLGTINGYFSTDSGMYLQKLNNLNYLKITTVFWFL